MALLEIVKAGNPVLKQEAAVIEKVDSRLRRLLDDMAETMYKADGVGLAAPQVGIAKRFLVCHDLESDPLCLVNPEILEMDGAEVADEGCLSIPRIYAPVQRAERIHRQRLCPTG